MEVKFKYRSQYPLVVEAGYFYWVDEQEDKIYFAPTNDPQEMVLLSNILGEDQISQLISRLSGAESEVENIKDILAEIGEELKQYLKDKTHHIEFLGRKTFEEIAPYLKSCLCTVVPSEWYDNFPNVILESFAYKKAVVATDIGSLPELVVDGKTGCLFKYGDIDDLAAKTEFMLRDESGAKSMGENAFDSIREKYSPEAHYAQLMSLFKKVIA